MGYRIYIAFCVAPVQRGSGGVCIGCSIIRAAGSNVVVAAKEGEENLPHTVNCRFKGDRSRPFRKCRPFGAAPNFELVGQFVNVGRARGVARSASIIWLQDHNPDIGWESNRSNPNVTLGTREMQLLSNRLPGKRRGPVPFPAFRQDSGPLPYPVQRPSSRE